MESKEAMLVMVHGSPRASANKPMHAVVDKVRERGIYPIVEVGFMECNEPTIPEAIDTCAAQGATRIIAVPYFLHLGVHVADDLPTLLTEAMERHPGIVIEMGEYLGRSPLVTDVLVARAGEAVAGA